MPRKTTEVEPVQDTLPVKDWRTASLAELEAAATDVVETGDGYPRLDNLNKLVDVPFFIVDATYRMGEFGDYYTCVCRFPNGSGVVITAGGQLAKDISNRDWFDEAGNFRRPVKLPRGLRASSYMYKRYGPDGEVAEETPATSWYIQDNPPDIH